jgi:hypothetical protein
LKQSSCYLFRLNTGSCYAWREVFRKNQVEEHLRQTDQAGAFHASTSLSQRQLAKKLVAKGIESDQSIISRIENQERLTTDIELIAIARILDISIGWLCGERTKTK